jgi:hypothetical protein
VGFQMEEKVTRHDYEIKGCGRTDYWGLLQVHNLPAWAKQIGMGYVDAAAVPLDPKCYQHRNGCQTMW